LNLILNLLYALKYVIVTSSSNTSSTYPLNRFVDIIQQTFTIIL